MLIRRQVKWLLTGCLLAVALNVCASLLLASTADRLSALRANISFQIENDLTNAIILFLKKEGASSPAEVLISTVPTIQLISIKNESVFQAKSNKRRLKIRKIQVKVTIEGSYSELLMQRLNDHLLANFRSRGYRTVAAADGDRPLFALNLKLLPTRSAHIRQWAMGVTAIVAWGLLMLLLGHVFARPMRRVAMRGREAERVSNEPGFGEKLVLDLAEKSDSISNPENTIQSSGGQTYKLPTNESGRDPCSVFNSERAASENILAGPTVEPVDDEFVNLGPMFRVARDPKKDLYQSMSFRDALKKLSALAPQDRIQVLEELNINPAIKDQLMRVVQTQGLDGLIV